MTEPLRILVADDEPLASERLGLLLARVDGVTLVGIAHDGTEAVALAEQTAPDVVMLDIAMPGLDGIEVARALSRLTRSPAVVFITAYDQFAVAAFEVAAVDYLMKPADGTRLNRALDRARTFLAQRGPDAGANDGEATTTSLAGPSATTSPSASTTTRSASSAASSTSCVASTTPCPWSASPRSSRASRALAS